MDPVSLPDEVRAACAWVAARARSVRIIEAEIGSYAATLDSPPESDRGSDSPKLGPRRGADREARAAFAVCLNAINFGSGWWPTIRKRPGHSGFFTVAAVLGQDPEHPLMAQFAAALRDVGEHLAAEHGGSFIAAGELARAGVVEPRDLDRLTAFADNLVPHVLRLDGVLRLDPDLTARIEGGKRLTHGSAEEVELRACAVHAVELLVAARGASGAQPLSAAEVDAVLWNRGRAPRYKSVPRPRSRNTAY